MKSEPFGPSYKYEAKKVLIRFVFYVAVDEQVHVGITLQYAYIDVFY